MTLLLWLRRRWCGLRGHEITLHMEEGRVWLACSRKDCGYVSPGWTWETRRTRPRWGKYLRFARRLRA